VMQRTKLVGFPAGLADRDNDIRIDIPFGLTQLHFRPTLTGWAIPLGAWSSVVVSRPPPPVRHASHSKLVF